MDPKLQTPCIYGLVDNEGAAVGDTLYRDLAEALLVACEENLNVVALEVPPLVIRNQLRAQGWGD